jgi:hypothetical protein
MVQPYRDEKTPLEWYVLPRLDVRPSKRPPFSFQVPKEVGRVGTESPSFVEPITSRKDGIQALFSKQRQTSFHPTSSPATPKVKRKLEDNSTPSGLPAELSGTVDANPSVFVGPSASKRPKTLTGDESNQPESVGISFPAPWLCLISCINRLWRKRLLKRSQEAHREKGRWRRWVPTFFRCTTHPRVLMIAGNSLLRKIPKSTHSSLKPEQLLLTSICLSFDSNYYLVFS